MEIVPLIGKVEVSVKAIVVTDELMLVARYACCTLNVANG
jgi:hypothetical protein